MSEIQGTDTQPNDPKPGNSPEKSRLTSLIAYTVATVLVGLVVTALYGELRKLFASEYTPSVFIIYASVGLAGWVSSTLLYLFKLGYLRVDSAPGTGKNRRQRILRTCTFLRIPIAILWGIVIKVFSGTPELNWQTATSSFLVAAAALALAVEIAQNVEGADRETGNAFLRRSGWLKFPDDLIRGVFGDGPASKVPRIFCGPTERLRLSHFALLGLLSFIPLVIGVPLSQAEHKKLYPSKPDPEVAIHAKIADILSGTSMRSEVKPGATFDEACIYAGGEPAEDGLAQVLEANFKRLGSEQAGCPLTSIRVSANPQIWVTPGTCGHTLRSLALASAIGGEGIVLQQLARFAIHEAVAGRLRSLGVRRRVGAGDMATVGTTLGTFVAARARSATDPKSSAGPLTCRDFSDDNVPYVILPPAAIPLWNDANASGFAWPTIAKTPRGDKYSYSKVFEFRRAIDGRFMGRVTCGANRCTRTMGGQSRSVSGDPGLGERSILESARLAGLFSGTL